MITRRKTLALTLALLCGGGFTSGQNAGTSSASAAVGPYRIAGVLVNAANGEPVRRGMVQALDDSSHADASCVTDNDGRFALEHLAAAKYQLSASKRGFRVQAYNQHDEFATSIVTGPDQDTTHLEFKLMPNAVLYGTITDDDGEPVANARVLLFKRPRFSGTGERTMQADATMTDDTGAYEFGNVAAGEYLLAVTAEPWYAVHGSAAAKRNSALDVAYPVTYFDSTTDERSATPVELAGGVREEANMSLHAVPALHLSVSAPHKDDGSISVPQLQQVAFGVLIDGQSATEIGGLGTGMMEVNGLAPGHYELSQGDPPRVADLELSSNQQVDAESGRQENALAGRVRMVSGAPVPEQLTVSLERMDNGPGQNQYATEARQGQFRFDSITPGEYAVWANAADKSMHVIGVGAGSRVQGGNLITVRDRSPELVVVASEGETRVEGFAKKDRKGFAGAMMVLLPKNTAQWKALTRRDQSDSDGSFAFRDVVPGGYTAIAIEDGWPLDWTSPAVMARYLPSGTNVTVTVNSGKLVRLPSPVTVQQR